MTRCRPLPVPAAPGGPLGPAGAPSGAVPFVLARLRMCTDQPGPAPAAALPYMAAALSFGAQAIGVLCEEVGEARAMAFVARLTSFVPAPADIPRQRQDWSALADALAAAAERP